MTQNPPNSGGNSQRDEPLEIKPDGDSLNPLFDEYGSGWRGRGRDKPNEQMPDLGDGESGLFRSDRVNVTSLIQQFLKAVFLKHSFVIS